MLIVVSARTNLLRWRRRDIAVLERVRGTELSGVEETHIYERIAPPLHDTRELAVTMTVCTKWHSTTDSRSTLIKEIMSKKQIKHIPVPVQQHSSASSWNSQANYYSGRRAIFQ